MGVFIAIAVEVLGIPVLAFAIGLYLPIHLSAPIFVGGVIKWYMEEKRKYDSEEQKSHCVESGVLYSAGMIAGEGIVGIILAVVAVFNLNIDISGIYGDNFYAVGNWGRHCCIYPAPCHTVLLLPQKEAVIIDTL